jgi:hypothetical protein
MQRKGTPEEGVDDHRIFLQHLAQAGWDVENWDVAHEAGASVDLDAEAEYKGPFLAFRLELRADRRYMLFQVSRLDGEILLRLRLHPTGGPELVLATIIAAQDTLNADNHPDLVKSLIPLSDPLLIEMDEGIFKLS